MHIIRDEAPETVKKVPLWKDKAAIAEGVKRLQMKNYQKLQKSKQANS